MRFIFLTGVLMFSLSVKAQNVNLKKIFSQGSLQKFGTLDQAEYEFSKHEKNVFYVWASWCPYCKSETPSFVKQYAKIKECHSIGVAAINVDKQMEPAQQALKTWGLEDISMYQDHSDVIKNQIKSGIPKVLITDDQGEILEVDVGANRIHAGLSELYKKAMASGDCKN